MDTFFLVFLFLIPILFLILKRKKSSKNVPPGSLGFPIVGQSLGLLRAMRANTAENWVQQRILKYGSVSKLTLFGKPTVLIYGQAANKFIFHSNSTILANTQPQSVTTILGDRSLLELSGQEHKRIRDALVLFLKPESLKRYVGIIDEGVKLHIVMYWQGRQEVKVLPLMKSLTFNMMCSLLFGIEQGDRREKLVSSFQEMIQGVWAVPINIPFTRYNRSLRSSAKVQTILKDLMAEKRVELEKKGASSHQDLITFLLDMCNKNNGEVMSEKEIIDNIRLLMIAGHDTTSVLLTLLIKLLAEEPAVFANVLQEQDEIATSKKEGEVLTWEDLSKMKYTWRVAMEILRMFPPVFAGFRKAVKDIEYEGYLIPKGWQIFWVASMTHMDETLFPEPTKFDPTRFENQSVPPYSYIPFGGGPRKCPGYEFARIETLVAIHYLVTRFTWKKLCADNNFRRDPMPVPTKGLPIQILPRKEHE